MRLPDPDRNRRVTCVNSLTPSSFVSSRRNFFRSALTMGAAAGLGMLNAPSAFAIDPVERSGKARFRTSVVGYSFREKFDEKDPAKPFTLLSLIDFAADQGFDAVELTGYYFPSPCSDADLAHIKRHAHLRGVAVSGTSIGGEFVSSKITLDDQIAAVKAGVDRAAFLGAPYLRVFAGNGKAMKKPGAVDTCIRAFDECAEYAGRKGIFLGLENDGGILPDTVLEITHGVKNPWFGLNLDLGNFHTPDVYADVARCAPYAINVHFKTLVQEQGKAAVPADYRRMLDILRKANYQGYLAFEYEDKPDPFMAIPEWKRRYEAALAEG
jgi:sugar phosphate isomerase/epimerase